MCNKYRFLFLNVIFFSLIKDNYFFMAFIILSLPFKSFFNSILTKSSLFKINLISTPKLSFISKNKAPLEFKYLKAIKSMEEPTLTKLSEQFNISKPSMNEVITKFEKSGLIVKEKSQLDKRITYLNLTEVGHTLSTTNMLESKKLVENLKKKLTMDEIDSMAKIFDKLGVDEL